MFLFLDWILFQKQKCPNSKVNSPEIIIIYRLPFNHKTLFGYIVALLGQAVPIIGLLLITNQILSFLIGSCWSFISFIDDIANELSCLKLNKASNTNNPEMKKNVYNIVQLYSDVKQLSSKCVYDYYYTMIRSSN